MQHLEPRAQRHLSFLKDRSRLEREAVGRAIIFAAFLALPVPQASRAALVEMIVVTARTARARGPAMQQQIRPARLLVWEHSLELSNRQLTDDYRLVLLNAFSSWHETNLHESRAVVKCRIIPTSWGD